MNIRDYFLLVKERDAWKEVDWIYAAFTYSIPDEKNKNSYDLYINRYDDRVTFYDKEKDEEIVLDFVDTKSPVFGIYDIVEFEAGTWLCHPEKLSTTWGNALFNMMAIEFPFRGKLPYINRFVDGGDIEKSINIARNEEDLKRGYVTMEEYQNFANVMFNIVSNLGSICVQSSSPGIIGIHPDVLALKEKLIKEMGHKFDDLVVVADFIKQLVDKDKETLKNDPAVAFMIKGKQYDIVRLRNMILHGVEFGFESTATFDLVLSSLREGWDLKYFRTYNNSLRDGSLSRGLLTALGGVTFKSTIRRWQNVKYIFGDCGTNVLIPRHIANKVDANRVVGNRFSNNGKLELVTNDNYMDLIGKTLLFRDPAGCKIGKGNYCQYCMGEKFHDTPTALPASASDIGSRFMNIFMKKMHGTKLETTELDLETAFI